MLETRLLEAFQGAQGFRQQPAAHGDDEAGLFGDRNEAVGRDELAAGVFPAQQGLGSDDLAGAQVDLRLIDDGQFAPLEGLAQVAQQGGALACRLADVGREGERLADAERLGAAQGDIGVLQYVLAVGAAVERRNAEADGDRMVDIVDQEGGGEQAVDARAVEQAARAGQRKGVAGDACDIDAAVEQHAQALGGCRQQGIAVVVTEHVVGGGELVDIDQGYHLARAAGLDALVEFDDQRIAVGQADLAVDQRIAAQFGDQVDILGAQRDIGAEDFQQVLVDLANRLGRLDVGGKTFLVVLAEIQGDVAPAHRAVVVAQGLVERAGDVQVVDLFQSMLDQVAVAAGGGDDPELIGVVGVLARCGADQALGRDADEAGQLGDDAFGKGMQALFGNELVAGGNDLLQPLAAFIQALQLVVGANGRGQRGVQPGVGQFAFCLVVVDVVAGDGVGFRRLARLAGAQDDADVEQHQVLADGLHRLEAGIVAFHDHIEQDHGDVVLAFEHGDGLAPRVGMDQLQATAKNLDAGQRELGGFVDIAVVIDDQDAPAVIRSRFIVGAAIFFDKEEIVVSVLRHGILKLGLGNFLSLI